MCGELKNVKIFLLQCRTSLGFTAQNVEEQEHIAHILRSLLTRIAQWKVKVWCLGAIIKMQPARITAGKFSSVTVTAVKERHSSTQGSRMTHFISSPFNTTHHSDVVCTAGVLFSRCTGSLQMEDNMWIILLVCSLPVCSCCTAAGTDTVSSLFGIQLSKLAFCVFDP